MVPRSSLCCNGGSTSSASPTRAHFLPNQPHRALPRFYQAADVLMVPSRSESFGLVAAEAQACGLPVVAAATGGLPHVVDDGVTGTLVAGHEPAAHAAAVRTILERPDLAQAIASAPAVAHSERFSWSATADRLLELLPRDIRGMRLGTHGSSPEAQARTRYTKILLENLSTPRVHKALWIAVEAWTTPWCRRQRSVGCL